MEEAAAQRASGNSFSLLDVMITTGDFGGDRFTRFINVKGHLIQLWEQIIWEFDVTLLNFVNRKTTF